MNKHLLILDLDGVLIDLRHKSTGAYYNYDFTLSEGHFVYVRPRTKEFLRFVFDNFQVAFWSRLSLTQTTRIIDNLVTNEQMHKIKFILARESCVQKGGAYDDTSVFMKNLKMIWMSSVYHAHQTLMIDCKPEENSINPSFTSIHPAPHAYYDTDDTTLSHLQRYLSQLVYVHNIPQFMERRPYQNHTNLLSKIRGVFARASGKYRKISVSPQTK